jgi:2,4-dienoyl-CoA reductase-like NADH-dependent reductase (Old Yellow Enzyme family)
MRLFDPVTLRPGVVARNRAWLAPLTNLQSHPDGALGDDERAFLAARAAGGFGLVETCAAYVAADGKAWRGELGVDDDAGVPALAGLASRLRADGALSMVQLFHGGLRADPALTGGTTWSASAWEEAGVVTPRAADEADVARVIAAFAAAAARCAAAGFDAVELHAAHGYLLSQFLSGVYNQRTDRWGGDLVGRARLLRATVAAVRAAAPQLALAVRLSPEDYGFARGIDLDETLQVARWLADDGVDVLHLSLWRSTGFTQKRPGVHPTPLFREAVGDRCRIAVAGGVWTLDEAEAQLALGADAVAVGRAGIANADWPRRLQAGAPLNLPPLAPATLAAQAVSPTFAGYLRRWKGFVAEDA